MERFTRTPPRLSAALRHLDRKVSLAVRRYELIRDGDRICVALSGGKDSWCLLEVLAARRSWVRERYELFGCHVSRPGCTGPELELALRVRCAALGVPLTVVAQGGTTAMPSAVDGSFAGAACRLEDAGCAGCRSRHEVAAGGAAAGCPAAATEAGGPDEERPAPEGKSGAPGSTRPPSPCFHCAWERRRLLFSAAAELGCGAVAFGHHLDDLAETVLLNLFFRGEISTMYPRQTMFGGKIVIIRPLALVEEKVLVRVAGMIRGELPGCSCGGEAGSQRARMKELISDLRRTCPGIRANLVRPVLAGWDPASGGHLRKS